MIQIKLQRLPLLAIASILVATPAIAQEKEPSVFDGDHLTIGAGAIVGPSYEGSDDYIISAAPVIAGKVAGIGIAPRAGGVAFDLVNDPSDAKVAFQIGPVVRLRFNRHSRIEDAAVFALGKRDIAVEVGANVGISFNQITNPYDSLTFSLDVRQDVAGAHKGIVFGPSATFQTPVSRGAYVALNVSAEHVDSEFANYYFSVDPAGSAQSGLRPYNARAGWKNIGVGLLAAYDLDGDLTNGGFALFAGGNYSRILGTFRDSPIVADRGNPDQFTGLLGVGYTF